MYKKTLSLVTLLFVACASAFAFPSAPDKLSVSANYGYSRLNGYMQIPRGGIPGTASSERPDFAELGIKHSTLWAGKLTLLWHNFGLYGGYQYQRPDGQSVLSQSFMSHGVLFPAGTSVRTRTKLDMYTLGAFYKFYRDQRRLVIYPSVEADMFDFGYTLNSATASTSRHFRQATPALGLTLAYHFTPRVAVSVNGTSSIPRLFNLDTQSVLARISYLLVKQHSYNVSIYTGLSYQRIEFKDKQTLANHILVKNWPLGIAGLRFTFQ